jgi:catechol 2,3-dioxygenase-like lactoylglutathione lyase family enzyme
MATEARPIAATGIDCVCYLAKDLARARNFYERVLGLGVSNEADRWAQYDLRDGTTFGWGEDTEGNDFAVHERK